MTNADRVSFTVRAPRELHDAWWDLYYATVSLHRLSFNEWMITIIREGITAAWYAADCPPARAGT